MSLAIPNFRLVSDQGNALDHRFLFKGKRNSFKRPFTRTLRNGRVIGSLKNEPKRPSMEVDVIVVGAGIIGLSICHEILSQTDLSVAVIDKAKPCAGATGAGQLIVKFFLRWFKLLKFEIFCERARLHLDGA